MHRTPILLHFILWTIGVRAFFPFVPKFLKGHEDSSEKRAVAVGGNVEASAGTSRGFISFKLSSKARRSDATVSDKTSRWAPDLAKKHHLESARRVLPQPGSPVEKRDSTYSVVTAAEPSFTNSAGIDQDGTDFSYFVEAKVGSGSTPLYMLIDTGASTTWLMSSDCTSDACTTHSTFVSSDSDTLEDTGETFNVEYGSGSVSGVTVSDSIEVAGLKVTMPFGLANETSDDFNQFPFDGILGLSLGGSEEQNFLSSLSSAGDVSSNLFGVSLSRSSDSTNTGEISFGAANPAKYSGNISYTSVDTSAGGNWAIPLDSVTVDGKSAGGDSTAYIDTGTTYAFGPPDDVEALFKLIPGSASSDGGETWTIPCDSNVEVAFSFSGVSYAVSSEDFVASSGTDNNCSCNIFGVEVAPRSWLLGDMFLKNVYTVFDVDGTQIGFASKADSTTTRSTTTTSAAMTTVTSNGVTATMPVAVGASLSATATASAAQKSAGERVGTNRTILVLFSFFMVVAMAA